LTAKKQVQKMIKPQITLAFDEHRNSEVVSLCFEKDFELISKVKSIPGAAWSQSRKFWYINKADFQLNQVFEKLKPVTYVDYSAINREIKRTDSVYCWLYGSVNGMAFRLKTSCVQFINERSLTG
jgi:hypothetical protein